MSSIRVTNLVTVAHDAPRSAFDGLPDLEIQKFRSDEEAVDIGLRPGSVLRSDHSTGQVFVYPLRTLVGARITDADKELWISLRFPDGELVLRFLGEAEKTSARAWIATFIGNLG